MTKIPAFAVNDLRDILTAILLIKNGADSAYYDELRDAIMEGNFEEDIGNVSSVELVTAYNATAQLTWKVFETAFGLTPDNTILTLNIVDDEP